MLKETIYVSTIELQGLCNTEEHKEKAFEEFKSKRIYNPYRAYIVRINVLNAVTDCETTTTEFEFYRVML